jgi:hypothetical protein
LWATEDKSCFARMGLHLESTVQETLTRSEGLGVHPQQRPSISSEHLREVWIQQVTWGRDHHQGVSCRTAAES